MIPRMHTLESSEPGGPDHISPYHESIMQTLPNPPKPWDIRAAKGFPGSALKHDIAN